MSVDAPASDGVRPSAATVLTIELFESLFDFDYVLVIRLHFSKWSISWEDVIKIGLLRDPWMTYNSVNYS